MAQTSKIEWTQLTWNPVVGCTKVSPGCKNCYAERMAGRLAGMAEQAQRSGQSAGRKQNYLDVVDGYGRWSRDVVLVREAIEDPLHWRSPRLVFVNSMSDLFHEAVPLSFIQEVFAVMNRSSQHTFQVLTKRPERVAQVCDRLSWTRNIWLGTSIENASVIQRIEALRDVDAAIRFLSVEPLIGPIPNLPLDGIHWVIVGGESGPGARLLKAEWVRAIRDSCIQGGVPFFFKQWGGVNKKYAGRVLDGRTWDEMPGVGGYS